MKRRVLALFLALLLGLTAGCARVRKTPQAEPAPQIAEQPEPAAPAPEPPAPEPAAPAPEEKPVRELEAVIEPVLPEQAEQAEDEPTVQRESQAPQKNRLIVIDPGHQSSADYDTEPLGPGSSEMKTKVSAGTRGSVTGIAEYQLNLDVSLLLEQELLSRGYEVMLTRRENDVKISNVERAAIANEAQADAFIRIHANGSESAGAKGAMTICMTPGNPYNAALFEKSFALSEAVVNALCEKTGAENDGVWQTDTMSGINWAEVPVTIVEMGYMTNQEEDRLLADDSYREKLSVGIADGIDRFFEGSADSELQSVLDSVCGNEGGQWDLWLEDLQTGESASAQTQAAPFVSASIIKLFIMAGAYEKVSLGELDEQSVQELVEPMITVSDNDAANRLIRLLGGGDAAAGMQAVNDFCTRFGCKKTSLNRLMLDDNGLQNYTSAEDCALLLRRLYEGSCVSAAYSEKMLETLKRQTVNNRIPAGLDAGRVCAHKTGDLSGLCCADVGIVYTADGAYILCAICNAPQSDSAAAQAISRFAQQADRLF